MLSHLLTLVIGIISAGLGGELFVRGLVRLSQRLQISQLVVGATIGAFATSSPEMAVSITAVATGNKHLALGDILGSNVINTALVLGIAASWQPLRCQWELSKRELFFALALPLLFYILATDGWLGRIDGLVCLSCFSLWLYMVAKGLGSATTSSESEPVGPTDSSLKCWLLCALGLFFLLIAGRCIVIAGVGIGSALGVGQFFIGTTLIAIGSSMPELTTTLISQWRGHHDISIGTILGSNIFNTLFILGAATLVSPMSLSGANISVALIFSFLTTLCLIPLSEEVIGRRRGKLLLSLYLIFVILGGLLH